MSARRLTSLCRCTSSGPTRTSTLHLVPNLILTRTASLNLHYICRCTSLRTRRERARHSSRSWNIRWVPTLLLAPLLPLLLDLLISPSLVAVLVAVLLRECCRVFAPLTSSRLTTHPTTQIREGVVERGGLEKNIEGLKSAASLHMSDKERLEGRCLSMLDVCVFCVPGSVHVCACPFFTAHYPCICPLCNAPLRLHVHVLTLHANDITLTLNQLN